MTINLSLPLHPSSPTQTDFPRTVFPHKFFGTEFGCNASRLGRQLKLWLGKAFQDGAQRYALFFFSSVQPTGQCFFRCRALEYSRPPELPIHSSASEPPPCEYSIVLNRWLQGCGTWNQCSWIEMTLPHEGWSPVKGPLSPKKYPWQTLTCQ